MVVRSYIQIFSAWWVTTILYNPGGTGSTSGEVLLFQSLVSQPAFLMRIICRILTLSPSPKISLVILPTVCHTTLMMFIGRIWYWSNYWDCCFPRTQISTNSEGWKLWPSTQCIGKDIGANPQLFTHATQGVAKVISEAFFTKMTGDHPDKLAAMDLSTITVTPTPSWFVWILTVVPVWLYFSW